MRWVRSCASTPRRRGIRAALITRWRGLLGLDAVELRRAERELASARGAKSLSPGALMKGREVEWSGLSCTPGQGREMRSSHWGGRLGEWCAAWGPVAV